MSLKTFLYISCVLSVLICILTVIQFKKAHTEYKVSYKKIEIGIEKPNVYYSPETLADGSNNQQLIINNITDSTQNKQQLQTNTLTTQEYQKVVNMVDISYPNAKLYQIADQYYQVYYDNQRVSPLFPLALANVETPGRADNNITWSALFPSKVVDFDLIDNFNVTYVAQDPITYNALMHEYSTRDRGALQMSPTYGTKNESYNSQMTGTEVEKLSAININPKAVSWAQGASSYSGDRFNIKDVCLRLASADYNAVQDIQKHNVNIDSEIELIIMMAMYHHRSGVWHVDGAGGWRSFDKALAYAKYLASQDMVTSLNDIYKSSEALTLDGKVALKLCPEWNKYTTSSLEASYPIKALYSYIVLLHKYGK